MVNREHLPDGLPIWRYTRLEESRETFESTLCLWWELNGDSITDDYLPEEESAEALWRRWVENYAKATMPILWYVYSTDAAKFEAAPFAPQLDAEGRGWLTYYSWPVSADEEETPVRFTELHVADKLW